MRGCISIDTWWKNPEDTKGIYRHGKTSQLTKKVSKAPREIYLMAQAHICKCTHLKTDHKPIYKNYKLIKRAQCEWIVCSCKSFKLKETKPSNYKNMGHALNTNPIINREDYSKLLPEYKTRRPPPMLISECTPDGFGTRRLWERPSKFNNGEYIWAVGCLPQWPQGHGLEY